MDNVFQANQNNNEFSWIASTIPGTNGLSLTGVDNYSKMSTVIYGMLLLCELLRLWFAEW